MTDLALVPSIFRCIRVTVGYRASVMHFNLGRIHRPSLGDWCVGCEVAMSTNSNVDCITATHHLGVVTDLTKR